MPSIANAGLKYCGERLTQFTNVFSAAGFEVVLFSFLSSQAASAKVATKAVEMAVNLVNFIKTSKQMSEKLRREYL